MACDVGEKLTRIVEAAGDRIKVFGDILDYADFFLPDEKLVYDEQVFDKRVRNTPGARELLTQIKQLLATVEPFEAAALEQKVKAWVEEQKLQISQIVHPLRVALTGKGVGFGLFDTLAILGREQSISRIDRAIARV